LDYGRPQIKTVLQYMLGDLLEVYVQTPEYCRRTITIGKNKIERKKARNTDLTRFNNCLRPRGRRGERLY